MAISSPKNADLGGIPDMPARDRGLMGTTRKVWSRKNRKFQILLKRHEMSGNDQKRAWERHLGAGTINFGDLGCRRSYSAVLDRYFDVASQDPKVVRSRKNRKCSISLKNHQSSRNGWKRSEKCLGASFGCWNDRFRRFRVSSEVFCRP